MNHEEINFKNLVSISYNFKKEVFNNSRVYCYVNLLKIIDKNSFKQNDINTDKVVESLSKNNINHTFTFFYSEIKHYLNDQITYYLNHDEDILELMSNLSYPDNLIDLMTLELCITVFSNSYNMLNYHIQDEQLDILLNSNLSRYISEIRSYEMLNSISSIDLSKSRFKKINNICEIDLNLTKLIKAHLDDLVTLLEQHNNVNLTEIFYESLIDTKTLQGYRGQPGQPFIINAYTMLDINSDFIKKFALDQNKINHNMGNSDNRLLHINDKGVNLIDCSIFLEYFFKSKKENIQITNFLNTSDDNIQSFYKLIISLLVLKFTKSLLNQAMLDNPKYKSLEQEYIYFIIFEILT